MTEAPFVPTVFPDEVEHRRKLAEAIQWLLAKQASGRVTIGAGTETVVTSSAVTTDSAVVLAAASADAAGLAGVYVEPGAGTFTIHHPDDSAGAVFSFVVN